MIILSRADVEERIDVDAARAAVSQALIAHTRGAVTPPALMHLNLGPDRGDLHVKGAWVKGAPTFTIKVAGSFNGAAAVGLPPVQGLSLVFDAVTGAPLALLDDGGWLTELRTAAAGAISVDLLAPPTVQRLAILGTGGQARYQLEAITRVRPINEVVVWGRRPDAAEAVREFAATRLGLAVTTAPAADDALRGADVVVTVTASRAPLVAPNAVEPNVLIVAVGADTPGKQELDPRLLHQAGLLVADDVEQSRHNGELQHAPNLPAVAIGALLDSNPAPQANRGLIVVDLTGLGVEDAAVADVVLQRARARSRKFSG